MCMGVYEGVDVYGGVWGVGVYGGVWGRRRVWGCLYCKVKGGWGGGGGEWGGGSGEWGVGETLA